MTILDIINQAIELSKNISNKEPIWGYNNIYYVGKTLENAVRISMKKVFKYSDLIINRYDNWHYNNGKSDEVKLNISISYEGELFTIGDIVFKTSITKRPYSKVSIKDCEIIYYDNGFKKDIEDIKKHLLNVKNNNTYKATKESLISLCEYMENRLNNDEPIIVENIEAICNLVKTYNNNCSNKSKITKDKE